MYWGGLWLHEPNRNIGRGLKPFGPDKSVPMSMEYYNCIWLWVRTPIQINFHLLSNNSNTACYWLLTLWYDELLLSVFTGH